MGRVVRTGDFLPDNDPLVLRFPALFDEVGRILDDPAPKRAARKKTAAKADG